MKEPEMDLSSVQWIGTALLTAIAAAFAHVHTRINRVEDSVQADRNTLRKALDDNKTELLGAINGLRESMTEGQDTAMRQRDGRYDQLAHQISQLSARLDWFVAGRKQGE